MNAPKERLYFECELCGRKTSCASEVPEPRNSLCLTCTHFELARRWHVNRDARSFRGEGFK